MGRQNYSHGKRLRELAKKQKREEKLQRKLDKKNAPPGSGPEIGPVEPFPDDVQADEANGDGGESQA